MKYGLFLCCLAIAFPLYALNTQESSWPNDQPLLEIYSVNRDENTRQAVRLGYQHFCSRLNTPDMTAADTQIALLIVTEFQPFFDKINQLESLDAQQRAPLVEKYQQEFETLLKKLAELFEKDQTRYTNPLMLDDKSAFDETYRIVLEASQKGRFCP